MTPPSIRAGRRGIALLAIALLAWPQPSAAQPEKFLCTMVVDRFSSSASSGSNELAASVEMGGPIQLKKALNRVAASSGLKFRFKSRPSSVTPLGADGKHESLAESIHRPEVRAKLEQMGVGHILVPRYHLGPGQTTVSATILDLEGNEVAHALEKIRDTDLGGYEALAKALLGQLCDQLGVDRPSDGFEVYVMPATMPASRSKNGAAPLDGAQVALLLKIEMRRLNLPRIRELEVAKSQVCSEVRDLRKTADRFIGINLLTVEPTDDGMWRVVGVPQVFKRDCKTDWETLFELPSLFERSLHEEIVRESKELIKVRFLEARDAGEGM